MLSASFLQPYRSAGDIFPNLLARSTYLSKYSRDGETWTDTVARVVLGSAALDPNVTEAEAHALFDVIWKGWALPPGRGLWTGGVPGINPDARYNCHYGTLRDIEDWCWTANMLMLGGGVGVGLLRIDELPRVHGGASRLGILCSKSHPNVHEVLPDETFHVTDSTEVYLCDDSREGWIEALRRTFKAAFEARDLVVNVSPVRSRGTAIKTFGGTACGPGPLATLLREVWAIIRAAQGRKLNDVECLDVTNHIGVCIKSGNVRRSALIALGNATSTGFRNAKKDWGAVRSFRHSSNNSIVFDQEEQFDNFDWTALVEDLATMGEPGIINLYKMRLSDIHAEGVNPCAEVVLHDREACCLSEIYPAKIPDGKLWDTFKLITRYTLRQRLQPMTDARAERKRVENMRIGVGLGGICDFDWTPADLSQMYSAARVEADRYADELGVSRPIAVTTVKPSGTISLLNGSSPGIHAPYAPYYVRRTRISKQEPMAEALVEAGVPHEKCVYDSTGNTLVFSFPMMARNARDYVTTETVDSQIERQMIVQDSYADNAVSTTISFREDEKGRLAELLSKHAKNMKSISCLPKAHGYEQPPYSQCTAEEFAQMHATINHDHRLTAVVGDGVAVDDCAGGVCPIR